MTQATLKSPTKPSNAPTRSIRVPLVLALLAVALLFIAVLRLCIGTSTIGWPDPQFLPYRITRLEIGLIVGVALAVSGVGLQALLRNPLAEPYVLGLSTGAGLGIMIQGLLSLWLLKTTTILDSFTSIHLFGDSIGALAGAAVAMLIVFLAGRRRGMIDPLGLLLTGVVLSTINGALIMLANYIIGPGGLREDIASWMMGYINEGVPTSLIYTIAIVTASSFFILLAYARHMDIATLSAIEAQALGVNLRVLRLILFLISSVLAACAVTLAGPIAFVGLICPHIVRLLLGPSHRTLLIGSAITGATLIVGADTLTAFISTQSLAIFGYNVGQLPIGIFTALIGGPVFLWMLHPRLGQSEA